LFFIKKISPKEMEGYFDETRNNILGGWCGLGAMLHKKCTLRCQWVIIAPLANKPLFVVNILPQAIVLAFCCSLVCLAVVL
jgi:hypothetical protein